LKLRALKKCSKSDRKKKKQSLHPKRIEKPIRPKIPLTADSPRQPLLPKPKINRHRLKKAQNSRKLSKFLMQTSRHQNTLHPAKSHKPNNNPKRQIILENKHKNKALSLAPPQQRAVSNHETLFLSWM
jgi:hypothetical protein